MSTTIPMALLGSEGWDRGGDVDEQLPLGLPLQQDSGLEVEAEEI